MEPDYTQTYQRAVTYVYDKAGNRLGTNDNGVVVTVYAPNDINQYQSISINNVADPISNGNEHEVTSYKNVSYTYLKDEHLIRATSGANTYDLAYDALGRCVKRTVNGVKKYYIYDGERPILEYKANGDLAGYNLYGKGIDEILMRYDPTLLQNQTFYYQQDHEGSITHLTDGSGNLIEKYRYDVFGNPVILAPNNTRRTASIVSNRFMFTGREFSNLFGFYEYRARAYNPLLGRFMSEDPKLFDAGDYNLFRYCHNDPIDFTDPMGLDGVSFNDHFNYFIQSPALDRNFLRGSFINVISRPSLSQQCAKGAQFMAGTVLKDGLHGVPTTHTAMGKPQWFQGPPVGSNTNGMLVARGFINGVYPSLSPEQTPLGGIVNHAAIQTGFDATGHVHVFDQSKGQRLDDSRYDAKREGWYVVLVPKGAGSYTKQSNDLVPTAQPNPANAAGEIISNMLHGLNPKLP
jgi:RHS repeat-associated protein